MKSVYPPFSGQKPCDVDIFENNVVSQLNKFIVSCLDRSHYKVETKTTDQNNVGRCVTVDPVENGPGQ